MQALPLVLVHPLFGSRHFCNGLPYSFLSPDLIGGVEPHLSFIAILGNMSSQNFAKQGCGP